MVAFDSVTVKSMLSPSSALPPETSARGVTDSSSSSMVPVALAVPSVAFCGFDSVSVNVSSSSSVLSSVVLTVTVFDVSPAANVSVPDVAV